MHFIDSISLLNGWFPIFIWILGGLGLLLLLFPRKQPKWLLKAVALVIAAFGIAYAVQWLLVWVLYVVGDQLPTSVLVWSAVGFSALLVAVFGMRGLSSWRKVGTPIAVVAVLLLSGLQINAYFGQYETVGSFYNADTAGLPALSTQEMRNSQVLKPKLNTSQFVAAHWNAPASMPNTGKLVTANIPGSVSGFNARDAIIYLPPAYLSAQPPELPVLVLVAGQPGGPQRWVGAGKLESIMNQFAQSHQGLAPVVAVVDPNGSTLGNTMCMDSQIAKAGTYLSADVPRWLKAHLNVQTDTSRWGFGGFSFGGTCALQMGTAYPKIYPNIIDLSGQVEPALSASRNRTIQQAFNGNVQAFEAITPLTLMKKSSFPDSFAYISVGADDTHYGPGAHIVSAAARAAGMHVVEAKQAGDGHSWASAKSGLSDALKLLAPRMGLSR